MNRHLLTRMANVLTMPDCLLFVGSGISVWSGLPTWHGLLSQLADFRVQEGLNGQLVRKELDRSDLLLAASYGFNGLTPNQIRRFLDGAYKRGIAKPHAVHRLILRLDPKCFITTNHDDLLEAALATWRRDDPPYLRVTNRQPLELANIGQARSRHFVFKPHGDLGDIESIILTKEQYRVLHGERRAALQTLETMFVSRPIVFLGFGLRDPDFQYIKDVLGNTYRGGAIDQYAVVADAVPEEADYWRQHYGIHILTYKTTADPRTGFGGHSALLELLGELHSINHPSKTPRTTKKMRAALPAAETPERPLRRYLAKVAKLRPRPVAEEFPLTVRPITTLDGRPVKKHWEWDGAAVTGLLANYPTSFILSGPPGAGKTYSVRAFCASVADSIDQSLIRNRRGGLGDFRLPIYVALRLFRGALDSLVEEALPSDFSLRRLSEQFPIDIFLDSFDELPREYIEDGRFHSEFAKLAMVAPTARIILLTRATMGMESLNLPAFTIDGISLSFVREKVKAQKGYDIADHLLEVVARPFFYQLLQDADLLTANVRTPVDLYQALLAHVAQHLTAPVDRPLADILSVVAFEAIDQGVEALPATRVHSLLQGTGLSDREAADLLEALIQRELLIPTAGSRVFFFHQSVTEFLAAVHFVRLYRTTPSILHAKAVYRRWDHTLALVYGLLEPTECIGLLSKLIELDLPFALAISRTIPLSPDAVSSLLEAVGRSSHDQHDLAFSLNNLPVTEGHIPALRALLSKGSLLGGAVAKLLLNVSPEAKKELRDLLIARQDDFNFGQEVGAALSPILDKDERGELFQQSERTVFKSEEAVYGLVKGLGRIFIDQEGKADLSLFSDHRQLSKLHQLVLREILQDSKDAASLTYGIELVKVGFQHAIFPMYLRIRWLTAKKLPKAIDRQFVERLIHAMRGGEDHDWAVDCLSVVLSKRPRLFPDVDFLRTLSPVQRLAVEYAAKPSGSREFWKRLEVLDLRKLTNIEYQLLGHFEGLHWSNRTSALMKLLRTRHWPLVTSLIESFRKGLEPSEHIRDLDFSDTAEWLACLEAAYKADKGEWLAYLLGEFIAVYGSSESRKRFLDHFNTKKRHRNVLATFLLNHLDDLSTDQFSPAATEFLLASLRKPRHFWGDNALLSVTATEKFVESELIPLISTADRDSVLQTNLRELLQSLGDRHRRRYLGLPKRN